ncbi:MAG TPA: cell division protein FtsZ [Dehalococcoidales bacterium]|jgi:cell division protein FtsZ|nr:cell division protein FtsZ [Dehalococcoidales bacterium]
MSKSNFVPVGANIKVVGLGGAGCNAITRMVREQIHGVEFIAMNTDAQQLALTEANLRLQLGERLTRGMGAGGDHTVGHKAAEESKDDIKDALKGADMVFVTAGMGGGTGTGSAAVVAEIAKQCGALTIAIVTKPFSFEGKHRMKNAQEGIDDLVGKTDTLVIIPNDRLLQLCDQKTSMDTAFGIADGVLHHGVQAIAETITVPGLINLDFADIRTIMKDAGPAWMSIGRGTGPNRAIDAAKEALASPLLDVSMLGAKGVLFNITGSNSLSLFEVNAAAEVIKQAVDPDANVIFGVAFDTNMTNEIRLTLIATGFANQGGLNVEAREKEINQQLKDLKPNEMDTPSFLRQRTAPQARPMPTPNPVMNKVR